jgi:hypothetical protein
MKENYSAKAEKSSRSKDPEELKLRDRGGTWDGTPTGVREVGRVDYSYYSSTDSEGEAGDLKVVTVTLPLTDSGVDLVQKTVSFRQGCMKQA